MKFKNQVYQLTIYLLLAGVLTFLFVGCSKNSTGESQAAVQQTSQPVQNTGKVNIKQQNEAVVSVETQTVKRGSLVTFAQVVGEARPYREVELEPRLQEVAEKINVQIGDIIKKDDLLIKLNSENQEITVQQAEASLAAAEANLQDTINGTRPEKIIQYKADLDSAKSNLKIAQTNYDRYKDLYDQGYISKQSFEEYENKLVSAKNNYQSSLQTLKIAEAGATAEKIKSLKANVKQAEASLNSAKLQLSWTNIKAPIAGVISDLNTEVGERASTASPVLSISQLDKIKIKTYVSQRTVNKIKVGEQVQVYFGAIDKNFTGIIKSISPVADDSQKSFPVEIVVNNLDYIIKAGMYAEIKLITNRAADQLLISKTAVLNKNKKDYVYIIKNKKAEKVNVKTGLVSEDKVEILAGLNEGDNVVITGAQYLQNGSMVNVISRGDQR